MSSSQRASRSRSPRRRDTSDAEKQDGRSDCSDDEIHRSYGSDDECVEADGNHEEWQEDEREVDAEGPSTGNDSSSPSCPAERWPAESSQPHAGSQQLWVQPGYQNWSLTKQDVAREADFGSAVDREVFKAIWRSDYDCVKSLLSSGANVNQKSRANIDGIGKSCTPLHVAAFKGHAKIVARLLVKGAAMTMRTSRGEDALQIAVRRNHANVATLLKRAGMKGGQAVAPVHLHEREKMRLTRR